jgi:hypothetical protein
VVSLHSSTHSGFGCGTRFAALSLTSQQLERREDVSRSLTGTAGQAKRKSLPPQRQQMNILRDAKDNDQFQWSLSVRVARPGW